MRDNIHAADLASAFWEFAQHPRVGEVYNIGGGRRANCSMLEAIELSQRIAGRELETRYHDENRTGDHIWWVSDVRRFEAHHPDWRPRYGIEPMLEEIYEALRERLA